jgi:hypothetical protein
MRYNFFKLANAGEFLLFVFIIGQGWWRSSPHAFQDGSGYLFGGCIIAIGGLQTVYNLWLCKLYEQGSNITAGSIVISVVISLFFLACLLIFGYVLYMIFNNMNRKLYYSARDLIAPLSLAVITALIVIIINGLYLVLAQFRLLGSIRAKFNASKIDVLEELGTPL